ncbi:MAG: endoribonuclease MazF [Planctomycetota bacterium]|nr:endoribonuclease MazF [Planctomycetaceae bacterium]MDQ3332421.1 endoribonuclease MazF [Planctomycetota bacterium]
MVKKQRAKRIPDQGDLVWLTFDPQAGHEQAGRRPALVLSPASYNSKVGLALVCPITNQAKGYPFEVALPAGSKFTGVVLADQVKSVDWRVREAQRVGSVPHDVMVQVTQRTLVLLSSIA